MHRKTKVTADRGQQKSQQTVRVWWPPTRDRKRTEFAGAYWPANLLNKTPSHYEVSYDNGELETCKAAFVFEQDHPCKFGQEPVPFSAGEFVEVSNGSKSDPCAWLARIRSVGADGKLMVDYPFHDTPAEQVQVSMVRRARVPQGEQWLLIAPHQAWEDGQILSPLDLELIPEAELASHLNVTLATSSEVEDGSAQPTKRKRQVAEEPAEGTSSHRKRRRKTKPAAKEPAGEEAVAAPTSPPLKAKRRSKSTADSEPVEGTGEAAAAGGGPAGSSRRASKGRAAPPRSSTVVVPKPMSAADYFSDRNKLSILLENPAAANLDHTAMDIKSAVQQTEEAWIAADDETRGRYRVAAELEQARCDRENAIRASIIRMASDAGMTFQQQQQAAAAAVMADKQQHQPPPPGLPSISPLPPHLLPPTGLGSPGGPGQQHRVQSPAALALCLALRAGAAASVVAAANGRNNSAALSGNPPQLSLGHAMAAPQRPPVGDAFPPPAPLPTPSTAPFTAVEVQSILNGGMEDMRAAKAGLHACGYGDGAYLLLMDVWREDSQRLNDALRAYCTHVRGCPEPGWDAFMVQIFGLERMAALKKPPLHQQLHLQQHQAPQVAPLPQQQQQQTPQIEAAPLLQQLQTPLVEAPSAPPGGACP